MRKTVIVALLLLGSSGVLAEDFAGRAELVKRLAAQLTDMLKAGEKPKAAMELLGKKSDYDISAADVNVLTVLMQGNAFNLKWDKVSNDDVLGIAKNNMGAKAERVLFAAEIAAAMGLSEQANDLISRAGQDPAMREKARELAARLNSGGTSGPAERHGPETTPAKTETGGPVALLGKPVTVTPEEDTATALRLPDAGLQTRMWTRAKDNYLPRANILYARFTWKQWGLTGDKQIGHYKDWMAKKRYMGLRMYCNVAEDLPEGATVPLATSGNRSMPMYWDPKYMAAHKRWVEGVAREIASNPYLSYVDIGGVGNTGGEWVVKGDFEAAGFTADAKDRLVHDTVRMYRAAFPQVRLYLATAALDYVKDKATFKSFLMQNNVGLRLDGLCGHTYEPNGWQRRAKVHEIWKDFPFQWEGAYATMEWEQNKWETAKVMDAALEYGPQSICYADGDDAASRFERMPDKLAILDKAGLKLGYRIAITRATYVGAIASVGRFDLQLTVANRGCSKMYADRNLEVALLDSNGQVRGVAVGKPNPGTSQWMPAQDTAVTLQLSLPKTIGSGTYTLAIGLLDDDPRRPDTRLEMAMKNHAADNRYILGPLQIGR